MKKIIIELEDKIYQELFEEWKKIQSSKLTNLNCQTFDDFVATILKSFVSTNKLTENFKSGNLSSLLDQLKDLVPSGDLSSLFDVSKKVNNSASKTNKQESDKSNEKYKS